MKRRRFLRQATAMGALSPLAPHVIRGQRISPLDKLQIGVIGCNGMGWANTRNTLSLPDVDLVAICDVDSNVIERRVEDYKEFRSNKPMTYTDYRELLNDKSIDAVIIGTPDHWHCLQMVDAVNAGKHVYVEKPVANTIQEAQIMTEAAVRTGLAVQTGQWQRSGPHYQQAMDLLWSGVLGKIRLVKVWAYQGWMEPIDVQPDGPAPEGVDYERWLGMAPKRAFNPNRFHFNFRWFWDYAGGLMTDWGVHEIDIALWGMKAFAPKSVMASGGKIAYPNDASETPDTLQAIFEYEDFNMLWEHATGIDRGPYGRTEGIAFIGNNGTLVVNRGGFEVFQEFKPEGYSERSDPRMESIEAVPAPEDSNYLQLHCANWVDAIKKNDPSVLNTPIQSGSIAAINAQMGNIAYRTGDKIFWDAKLNAFKDNDEANKLVNANYQNGYKLPE